MLNDEHTDTLTNWIEQRDDPASTIAMADYGNALIRDCVTAQEAVFIVTSRVVLHRCNIVRVRLEPSQHLIMGKRYETDVVVYVDDVAVAGLELGTSAYISRGNRRKKTWDLWTRTDVASIGVDADPGDLDATARCAEDMVLRKLLEWR